MSSDPLKICEFEHHFQQRIMVQTLLHPLAEMDQVAQTAWKTQWTAELSKWHSPYALVLATKEKVASDASFWPVLASTSSFFKKFFLKKVVLCGDWQAPAGSDWVIEAELDPALQKAGWRGKRAAEPSDFRGQIQFENFFKQNVMELSFASQVLVDSADKIRVIKSKLTNQLMQWHSPWSLMVNCANLEVAGPQIAEMTEMLDSFKKLYMLKMIGYSPLRSKLEYPFKVYRSRHKAAAELESSNAIAGDTANCSSRKA